MEEIKEEVKTETKTPLLDEAAKTAERIEKANAEYRELLAKHEEMVAKQMLGGRSNAGGEIKPEPELSPIEYAKAFSEGKITGKIKADIVKQK
jgi:hypothetical protein